MYLRLLGGEQHQLPHAYVRGGNLHALPLVRIVLQPSFDVDPITLLHVLFSKLGQTGPKREAMPVCPLLGFISERRTVGRQAQVHDLGTLLGLVNVRITPDIAYENDLVDGAAHLILPRDSRPAREPAPSSSIHGGLF